MPEENISTALGAFLHKRRLLLGKETISAFLRDMDIPFTDNYYRDIEAGRKKLSIEAAVQLHDCLGLTGEDSFNYYWHFFRDHLPEKTHNTLFGKSPEVAEKSLKEINSLREYDAKVFRKALALSRYEREYIAEAELIEAFETHFEMLPLMHYVYMVRSAKESEIKKICSNLRIPYDESVRLFIQKFATISKSAAGLIFQRKLPTLRVPRNERGLALKNRFLLHEVGRSLGKSESSEYFNPNQTFRYSGMFTIKRSSLVSIQNRMSDLLASVEVETKTSDQLDDSDADPYFVAIIVSGCEEYDGRK